jgi:hypothetical protein
VNTRFSALIVSSIALFSVLSCTFAKAQTRRSSVAAGTAIVVDERLSVLRASPELSGKLLRRVGRGRKVTILGQSRSKDGIVFYHVSVSSRTRGWMQREALISGKRPGDDVTLLSLIMASDGFDRIARARIFLDTFPKSSLRPVVLLAYGDAAEGAATRLTRDASRRLNSEEIKTGGAPDFSYYLNYSGLDRYNRQGVKFIFDRAEKRFYYDGAAWREILRRHPQSDEVAEARKRLDSLNRIQ